jgi:hypothetical protein
VKSLDPTGHDALFRALAWLHPAWMTAALAVAALALRAGLGLRRARRAARGRTAAQVRRHTRLGKVAVTLVLLGFASGPLSMAWLRGREPFGTAHALAGVTTALCFLALFAVGRRLERGRGRPVEAHAALALLASLAAAVSAVTGFVLLP